MNTFSERLKSARLKAGLSLRSLAEELGTISFQALGQYEKGMYFPDSEKLAKLCKVLNVRPDYFTREQLFDLGEVSFRKLKSHPEKDNKQLIEETRDYVERFAELKEFVGENAGSYKKELKRIPVLSIEEAEHAANKLRVQWKMGDSPITNLTDLLEDKGFMVLEVEAKQEVDGLSTFIDSIQQPVIVVNKAKQVIIERKRFTIAHELAHLILEIPAETKKDVEERWCNRFAAAFLLPKTSVFNELGQKRKKILQYEMEVLKTEYGISVPAIVYRLFDLGIFTTYDMQYWMKHLDQIGYRSTSEPSKFKGEEVPRRFDQLIVRCLAEEFITVSKAAALCNLSVSAFRDKYLKI